MLIKKIRKYLGKINFMEDAMRESHDRLIRMEESSRDFRERLAKLEESTKKKESEISVPYSCIKVRNDIVYIGSVADEGILGCMRNSFINFADAQIDLFFDLTEKHYGKRKTDGNGYFLDIGANIGTTSLYVKKVINPNLKVIAFEPSSLNYKMLRCNCILNDFDDIRCENFGLSNIEEEKVFLYVDKNSGGGGIGRNKGGTPGISEYMAPTRLLDSYMKENSIPADALDYIWIDVEGHEVEVLEGSIKTLTSRKIPLISEFNAPIYIRENKLSRYVDIVRKIYTSFIDCRNAEIIHPIGDLADFAVSLVEKEKLPFTDLFFF